MKRLIYKAVFSRYDRVYPPIKPEKNVDYVIVTDDKHLKVSGWNVVCVDGAQFVTPKAANLYYRAMIHRLLPQYDFSLYSDGNIRLLGPTLSLFEQLVASKAAILLFPHPTRRQVSEELEAVIQKCKVSNPICARREVATYLADGFPDNVGLADSGVILKNHRHPDIDKAMELWWSLFERHLSRDQLSLPYVIWKMGLDTEWYPESFRKPNIYFATYPHQSKGISSFFGYLIARSHDSYSHRILLKFWTFGSRVYHWARKIGINMI